MAYIKYCIEILKGHDKNNKPFTTIILLTEKECEELKKDLFCKKVNLEKYNIIYKQLGHNIKEEILDDIKKYCEINKYIL
jgi:hypothetical protein